MGHNFLIACCNKSGLFNILKYIICKKVLKILNTCYMSLAIHYMIG